jgi:hypothetical protein
MQPCTDASLFSSFSRAPSSASPEDAYHHHGFFIRPDLGLGYLTMSEATGTSAGTEKVSGLAGTAGVAIGGALADNLVLSLHLYDAVAVNPSVSLGSSGSLGTSSATITGFGIGPELDYYFMPANVYLAATVAVTTLSVSVDGQSVSASAGPGGKLSLGKEWFVGNSWGLGVAGGATYASNTDTGGQGIGTWVFALSFTATYNQFRDPRTRRHDDEE